MSQYKLVNMNLFRTWLEELRPLSSLDAGAVTSDDARGDAVLVNG